MVREPDRGKPPASTPRHTDQAATLLADIGGTNARFAILAGSTVGETRHFATSDYASPLQAMRTFMQQSAPPTPTRAVIAAAGPIKAGRVHMTNADWTLDTTELAIGLKLDSVDLINDFAAQAWAVPALPPDTLRAIGGGVAEPDGPQAVIGAGTGFGMALRICNGRNETIVVTEGGHASLAANDEAEDNVLRGLRKLYGHVSVERVLSGPGLADLYRQLADGAAPARGTAEIVAHALDGRCGVCGAALDMFCAWLGSVAGDVALSTGAAGGVYLSGGVMLHFLDYLAASRFRQRFEAKGRLAHYVAAIPTVCVTHPDPAFLGLARYVQKKQK